MSSFTRFDSRMNIQYAHQASEILGKDYWRVVEGFRYYLGEKGSNRWVDVPAGYLTDGASVPRLFWGIVPPWGAHGQAAVAHDILCEYLTLYEFNGVEVVPIHITRKECDRIFAEAMKVLKVNGFNRFIMSSAVNSFRVVSRTKTPTLDLRKLALENQWRRENTFIEPANVCLPCGIH